MFDVSFIIVSYNSAELIERCIESIQAITDASIEIFVIDNHSRDKSAELVRGKFPQVRLIANHENMGFGAANNQAIPLCQGKYIFFLNPDTQIQSGSIRSLIRFMDDNPQIGLCGTKIIEPDGSIQWSVSDHYPGQRHTRSELAGLKGDIACVLGACMISRSDLIKQIGGFDEDYFLYGEDQDLCLRIRKLGYEIGYCDTFTVRHLGGHSERDSTAVEILKRKITAEHLFYKKHYPPRMIRRILREELLKSKWRLFTIKMFLPFCSDKKREEKKLARYRISYSMAKKLDTELKSKFSFCL